MTLRIILLVIVSTLTGLSAHADVQNLQALRTQALQMAEAHYQEKYAGQHEATDIQITVKKIDPRLRLSTCDDNLTFTIKESPHSLGHASINVRCMGAQSWSIYLNVKIDLFGDVLIASRNLDRRELLDSADIDYQRINLTSLKRGFIQDESRATGMEIKRPIKVGQPIYLSHLKLPDVVLKGQEVQVEARKGPLSVQTQGIALNSGAVGKQIKIKNSRSERIIAATIVGPGKVQITY